MSTFIYLKCNLKSPIKWTIIDSLLYYGAEYSIDVISGLNDMTGVKDEDYQLKKENLLKEDNNFNEKHNDNTISEENLYLNTLEKEKLLGIGAKILDGIKIGYDKYPIFWEKKLKNIYPEITKEKIEEFLDALTEIGLLEKFHETKGFLNEDIGEVRKQTISAYSLGPEYHHNSYYRDAKVRGSSSLLNFIVETKIPNLLQILKKD